jgi:hypothetical protein
VQRASFDFVDQIGSFTAVYDQPDFEDERLVGMRAGLLCFLRV